MRSLLLAMLLVTTSCESIWGESTVPNPRNCVRSGAECGPDEVCDVGRQICVPASQKLPVELVAASPDRLPRKVANEVELRGSGFQSGVKVYIGSTNNQQEAEVLEQSGDRLRVRLPASPKSCGLTPIHIVNPDGGEVTESSLLRFILQEVKPLSVEDLGQESLMNSDGLAVAVSDTNQDGLPDVLVASSGEQGVLQMLQDTSGQFSYPLPAALSVGAPLFDLSAARLDAGVIPHVVIAPRNGAVLLARGNQLSPPYQTLAGTRALNVAIADMNKDGRPDLMVGDTSPTRVRVFLGAGDGTVSERTSAAVSTCGDLQYSALADA